MFIAERILMEMILGDGNIKMEAAFHRGRDGCRVAINVHAEVI